MVCERCRGRRTNSPYPMDFERMAAICFLALVVSFLQVADAKLSDYTDICRTKDPNLNDCLRKSAQKMFGYMKTGIKELKMPIMDPYVAPELEMGTGADGPMSLKFTLFNATHTGFSKSKVKKVEANPAKYSFDYTLFIPKFEVVADYDILGKLIMMPVHGQGVVNTTLYDLETKWKVRGEPEEFEGKTYFKTTKLEQEILGVKKVVFNFGNLFNGNKEMSDMFNKLVNDNWEELFKQLKSSMEKNSAGLMMKLAKKSQHVVPYSEVFPDLFEGAPEAY
uniref:Protein takeout n=1 Tax=Cacopsylla melanoneura TaxID=428564 RepID=A0A8D8LN05_9HEMI